MLDGLSRDLVSACRSLGRARSFTLVCVASLGIGMTPVIAIPYAMRIATTPPPDVDTRGLVEVHRRAAPSPDEAVNWSYPEFVRLREADTGVSMMGWAIGAVPVQTPEGAKTSVRALFVSPTYFKTIGVTIARGHDFSNLTEDQLKAEPVVVLADSFWRNTLGADPDIVGKAITVNGVSSVVVGIAPELFQGHLNFMGMPFFVPLERHPVLAETPQARFDAENEWVHIHGRLRPGVSVTQANAAVAAVTSQAGDARPEKIGGAEPYGTLEHRQFRLLEAVGLTLTGMVLLVVCLNISGMMQVRGALRERDLSIRQAIGATRGRLIRYLLSEAIVLAAAGAALASIILFNLPSVISWMAGAPIPAQLEEALRLDLFIVGLCGGLSLVASLMLGLLPAIRFSRPDVLAVLKDEAGAGGLRVGRVHRVTAALQVAIAVPLLVMSGMSLDRVRATASADLGFASDLLYAAPIKLDAVPGRIADFRIRSLRDRLARMSGVASATVADGLPLDFRGRGIRIALETPADVAPQFMSVRATRIGDGYLDTMGISLLAGRAFAADDGPGTEPVVIVSGPLAKALLPGTDVAAVVGKRLVLGPKAAEPSPEGAAGSPKPETFTIVGVTGDFPTSQMSTERPQILLPLAQHPAVAWGALQVDDENGPPHIMLIARSAAGVPPQPVTTALEELVRELDPEFKATSVVTGVWLRQNSMRDFFVQSAVAAGAGGVILLLSALGIYGVVGLTTAARTREIAVRVALGASRRRVLGMVLFDVLKLVTPGVAAGLLLTVALNRINSENMGIPLSRLEPLAYVAGAAVAVLVAVVASLSPARRAASVQPTVAMRSL